MPTPRLQPAGERPLPGWLICILCHVSVLLSKSACAAIVFYMKLEVESVNANNV